MGHQVFLSEQGHKRYSDLLQYIWWWLRADFVLDITFFFGGGAKMDSRQVAFKVLEYLKKKKTSVAEAINVTQVSSSRKSDVCVQRRYFWQCRVETITLHSMGNSKPQQTKNMTGHIMSKIRQSQCVLFNENVSRTVFFFQFG